MIYFFILGFIFLVGFTMFFLYWPSRQFSTVSVGNQSINTFPPEYGFWLFMLGLLSFLVGLLLYKKSKKKNELALLLSLSLIATWLLYFSSKFLVKILLLMRPDLLKDNNSIIGFEIPSFTPSFSFGQTTISLPSFEYLHLLLLLGLFGVVLFYGSLGSLEQEIKKLWITIDKIVGIEYKISFIISFILFSLFFLLFLIISLLSINLNFILILILAVIISLVLFISILIYLISVQFQNIDKTKLNIRKNCIATGVLVIVVLAALLDLLFLFFFSNIPTGESFFWRFRDVISNALFTGMIYLQISLGITLVFKIMKFANFSHAELVTFGAYVSFIFGAIGDSLGIWNKFSFLGFFKWIPVFIIVGIIAFIATSMLAYIFDIILYKPLRRRDASPITLMIASFALGLSFRMVLQQTFTTNPIPVSLYFLQINLDSIVLRIMIITSVLFSTWFFQILLYKTKYGKIMRAVSDNEDLAKITGIKTSRIHFLVWIIAGGFAGVAGLLFTSYPVGAPWIKPDVGFILLLSAFAVAVLGGIGSFEGVVIASLIIGFTENMGVIILNQLNVLNIRFDLPVLGMSAGLPIITNLAVDLSFDSGYKVALSYVILILVLKIRPYGLLGEKPSGDR